MTNESIEPQSEATASTAAEKDSAAVQPQGRGRAERARSGQTILEVNDLSVRFPTPDGVVKAVSGLSYHVELGRTLAIVGESGSGKSVSSMAVMGLHDTKKAQITGSIKLDGEELVGASSATFRKLRSRTAAMIFQDPQSSFHPYKKIGHQLAEAYLAHHKVNKKKALERSVEMLDRVGIPNPDKRAKQYPHEFSGGMRQRAMIALGLINDPKLLIADEPTTALDVTVQAQILDLLNDLQKEFGSAIIMITHDLAVVAEVSDDVLVMYGGRGVEFGTTKQVLADPRHPYTWGLLGSVPSLSSDPDSPLLPVRGNPPSLLNLPSGCSFNPRCDFASRVPGEKCTKDLPEFTPVPGEEGRMTRCHLAEPAEIFAEEIAPRLGA